MATISNTIRLQDKMTPILRNITNALTSTINILESTDTASSQAFNGIKRDVQNAINSIDQLTAEVQELEGNTKKVKSGFSGWQSAIVTANQAIQLISAGVQKVGQVTQLLDSYSLLGARVGNVTDELNTQESLQQKIFESAQRSRASYADTAAAVSKLGLLAGDAFSSNEEAIAFAETLNKSFVISGTSAQEASSAMYQLTQAMAAGKLQGDEFRSVMENAPMVAQAIADYTGKTKGELKEMSSEGLITADIIKNAMSMAAEDINTSFENMPKTFGQMITTAKNEFLIGFQPIIDRFNEFINSDAFESFYNNVIAYIPVIVTYIQNLADKIGSLANSPGLQALGSQLMFLGGIIAGIINLAVGLGTAIVNNWSWISPLVYGIAAALAVYYGWQLALNAVQAISNGIHIAMAAGKMIYLAVTGALTTATAAQTAAQFGLNAAMYACPIVWIIALIILVIALIIGIIAAIKKLTGSTQSTLGIIVGAIMTAVAFIWNTTLAFLDTVLAGINFLWSKIATFVNFFANVFKDPIGSIIHLFGDMADSVLGVLETIAKTIDKVFGTNMAGTVAEWRSGLDDMVEKAAKKHGNGKYEEVVGDLNLSSESLGLKRWGYKDAYGTGYEMGESAEAGMSDMLSGFDMSALGTNMEDTALATSGTYDLANGKNGVLQTEGEVSITEEDIKLLKDVAKVEWVNQYTALTPELTVTFGDVHETADVNEIAAAVETLVVEAYASALSS